MTHHLISLCAVRDTPGCCVNGLSMTLSEILGIKSVLAVGFRVIVNLPSFFLSVYLPYLYWLAQQDKSKNKIKIRWYEKIRSVTNNDEK